jgi:hypothetical protein
LIEQKTHFYQIKKWAHDSGEIHVGQAAEQGN